MYDSRLDEWFVPKFGPLRFRVAIGMLFLPYTGMCVSFVVIGSLLADNIIWDRLIAIVLIYLLALGVSAHALDSIGSKRKPWGNVFSNRTLLAIAIIALAVAYTIGIYYIVLYVPFLAIIAVLEGFFLFAYNVELFNGRFHSNLWFSISWGGLPLLAGYVMQTNSISISALIASSITALVAYAEIRVSRPYKELKRSHMDEKEKKIIMYERMLKLMSIGSIGVAISMLMVRMLLS
ncbi:MULTISPECIES: hypothetical protein [Candidatus Nitrosocaldus]|jgi:hypothetical protein|uniref:Putative 1,4-dihydroxy-2-naphthoate octaprenyltransferase n=1 Tax=Candidatus Nitrosocaldus cavascurensis TaxID=2058097 RepID=A0A2K5APT7_9ARCH|nr:MULTISPECIES: hypothetical protein [Candidatus Nitrosocaldus]SPC33661.1 putative 1,4-dihydroxy-2-naphthoate octaprenyltransferase [Candidatus Nitrosocaldus cavascurensis]